MIVKIQHLQVEWAWNQSMYLFVSICYLKIKRKKLKVKMEPDRFVHHHVGYILGMICLVLCLGLLGFSFYMAPFFIWHLNYNVPFFITEFVSFLINRRGYSAAGSELYVWLIFFIPGIITGILSFFISNYIDNQIYKVELQLQKEQGSLLRDNSRQARHESMVFALKVLGLIILCVFVLFLLQDLIQIT